MESMKDLVHHILELPLVKDQTEKYILTFYLVSILLLLAWFSVKRTAKVCSLIVVYCSICISTSYVVLGAYKIWKQEGFQLENGFLGACWILSTFFTYYFKLRSGERNHYNWSVLLVLWWASFGLYNSFTISIYFFQHFLRGEISLPDFLLKASIADLVAFPFCLCINISSMISRRSPSEIEEPLIRRETDVGHGASGYELAGIWSKLTFCWLNQVFKKGRIQKLELSHIPQVPLSESAESCYALLQESLFRRKTKGSPLAQAIIHAIWKPLAVNAIFAGMNTLSSYMGPFLITNFVDFLSGKETDSWLGSGYVLAFLFFFFKTMESLSQRQWYFGARRISVRVTAAFIASIYNKTLSLKYSSSGSGKIINFLDVDVERIGDFAWYFHSMWLLPIQIILALLILYRNLGAAAAVATLVVTVVVMVSNIPLANKQERLHSKIMEAKDSRMKATIEILKCMRILKLHSWEDVYLNKLLRLRDVERGWVRRYLYTCSAVAFLFWASPTLVSVVTFGVCIATKTPLTPGSVLSALATFRILQDPIYNLPELVSMIAQTKVSIDRVQEFVEQDQQRQYLSENNTRKSSNAAAVEIEPGEYGWEVKPTIKIETKININRGQKVAVCGSVGSGKSSFLCSIIGEIPRISGAAAIKLYGSRSYAPQTAWIQTGTVRENVLFGKKMERGLYDEVIKGCALDKDMEAWVDSDMTVVGERGMNLSGGQKQRIQLARAIYSDSDVYLLDDPFSAVDAHTGGHLFQECLMRLLSDKTVIYVTHQLEYLSSSDLVLVIKNGKIVQQGKFKELISDADGELVRQMTEHEKSTRKVSAPNTQDGPLPDPTRLVNETEVKEEPTHRSMKNCDRSWEEHESGRVKWKIYSTFVTIAFKGALVPVILLCQVLFQTLQIGSNYWISWATERSDVSSKKLMGVFISMSLGSSIFILARALLLATVAIETAQRLFVGMTTCIFRVPISFFDFTPSSRVHNRSSTDQSIVDTDIPYRLAGLVFALVQLLCIIILMSQLAWPILPLFIIVVAISFWYQAYYISTARELARMVGIRKAPILHHFSESISGAVTIRCFNQESRFTKKNLSLIDDYSRVTFHNYATMEWLSIRVNFLFNLIFFIVLIILVTLPKDTIDPSLAGLATTYGLSLNVLQAWIIWNLCNVENKMISVERIMQFSDLPSEAPLVIEENRPQQDWPRHGTIELDNLHICYSPGLPMVLKGVSCMFPGKRKIGVVGRTGSGKSTLIQALFRVVEPSQGRILIDGVDICRIGLHDLRSRLSIIPQDPSMFQGTVRTNLDPLQEHSDFEIWEVLHRCRLSEIVMKDHKHLDAPVAEDGENWSVGQRQLVCLVRALLKKRRILVLDEATASVDTATDNVIQKTIREETGNCTVISVAHRLATVIDNDLVLVLDDGKVVEYDSPNALLQDKSSAFSKLVMEFLRHSKCSHHSVFPRKEA